MELEMKVHKITMVYFFRMETQFKTFDLTTRLYNQFSSAFGNNEPQVIPLNESVELGMCRCIWEGNKIRLNFTGERLEIQVSIPSEEHWEGIVLNINDRVQSALGEIKIDRVGFVSEAAVVGDLRSEIDVKIPNVRLKQSKEIKIAWRENIDEFNQWTNIFIDDERGINEVVFDINTMQSFKLTEADKGLTEVMKQCVEQLKGMMEHVL